MRHVANISRVVVACAVTAASGLLVAGVAGIGHAATPHVYFVAPGGSDSAAGTQSAPWRSIAHAQSVARPGDTVYFRGGTYTYTRGTRSCSSGTDRVDAITLDKSGSSGNPISYVAYPGEKPLFDFSHMADDCRIKGFDVTGSSIHLKGLELSGVPQNNKLNHESWGVWVSGSDNTFERLDIHNVQGTGLFIQDGGGNLVLNSDSHDNFDPRSSNGAGQNSDGFGAHISANHVDYNMLGISPNGAAIGLGNLRNNVAYGGTPTSNMSGTDAAYNSWNLNVTMSNAQFQSVSTSGWNAARKADGSLPNLPYLHLASTSTLIDRGENVGLPYSGKAPDLGAFEER